MGAGNRDSPAAGHDRGQRLGAVQNAQTLGLGSGALRIRLGNGSGEDDGVEAFDVTCVVTHMGGDADGLERRKSSGVLGVAAADRDPALDKDARDA